LAYYGFVRVIDYYLHCRPSNRK